MIGLPPTLTSVTLIVLELLFLKSILSDMWKVLLLPSINVRRRTTITMVSIVLFGVLFLLAPATRGHTEALPFLIVALLPPIAWQAISWWAWFTDPSETRDAARQIAIDRANRDGDVGPAPGRRSPWKDYIFDVEDAHRQAAYEPPPI